MLQMWFVANTILWPLYIEIGGFQLGLNVVLLGLAGIVWLSVKRRVARSTLLITLGLLAYLVFSLVTEAAGPCQDRVTKFFATAPILIFLVLFGLEIGRRATSRDWLDLQKVASWTLVAAFFTFLVEMALPSFFAHQAGFRSQGKYSGILQEPSHVAFALFPCIAILLVADSKTIRRRGLLAAAGLLILSRSSTLIALIAAWFLYRLFLQEKLRKAALLLLGMACLVIVASAINYDALVAPTVSRIAGIAASSDTENISSLVYVQGWEDAFANFKRTHGLGLGFNMMGCHPLADVPARRILTIVGLEEVCLLYTSVGNSIDFSSAFYNEGVTQYVEASTMCRGGNCGEFVTDRTHFGFVYTRPDPKALLVGDPTQPIRILLRAETIDMAIAPETARQQLVQSLRTFLGSAHLDDLARPYGKQP